MIEPLVSVIIPCYNHVQFIRAAIESVLAQRYSRYEVVVVNDGSPEGAELRRVVAEFGGRIQYIEQDNQGISAARNRALDATQGEYLVFLDADDRLLPNALAAGAAALNADSARGLVWGARRTMDAAGEPLRSQPDPVTLPCTYASLLTINIVGPPVSAMFRRTAVEAVGRFSALSYAEDYELYLRVARRHELFWHGELVAEYRVHGRNRSKNYDAMHRSVRESLAAQRPLIRGNTTLEQAVRLGLRNAREQYWWEPRLRNFLLAVRQRRWRDAGRDGGLLMIRYPIRFPRYLARRLLRGRG